MKKLLFYTYAKNKDTKCIKNTSCICSKIANILFLTGALLSEFLSCHEGTVSQFLWHQQGIVQNNQYLKLYLSVGFIMTIFIYIGINYKKYCFLKKNKIPLITCCCPSPFDFSLHGSKNQAPISSVFLTCKIKSYM